MILSLNLHHFIHLHQFTPMLPSSFPLWSLHLPRFLTSLSLCFPSSPTLHRRDAIPQKFLCSDPVHGTAESEWRGRAERAAEQ